MDLTDACLLGMDDVEGKSSEGEGRFHVSNVGPMRRMGFAKWGEATYSAILGDFSGTCLHRGVARACQARSGKMASAMYLSLRLRHHVLAFGVLRLGIPDSIGQMEAG